MRRFPVLCVVLLLLLSCSKYPRLGDPLRGLTKEQKERFEEGKEVFERVFTPKEGLGPSFNAPGCAFCHNVPKTGGSSAVTEIHASKFVPPDFCDPLFEEGGPVIEQQATPLLREKGIEKEEIPPSASGQALRTSPQLFGFGLIDGIPEVAILANADPDDIDGDGISGRANRFIDGRVGRFGRKAFLPDLFEFNAGAFPIEQGVTTPLQPVEETINGVHVPPETDPVFEPEIDISVINAVTDFTRFLSPPPKRSIRQISDTFEKKAVLKGKGLFRKIGCVKCHIPSMRTGQSEIPALNREEIFLYSDLLLHDMGPGFIDICLGLATPSEFRTEMLMGLRFKKQFLHDGSAVTVREAIERHGGEARASREEFDNLKERDKKALIKFLEIL
jgi:CxxC motif-containing protein (DUF1111 family)